MLIKIPGFCLLFRSYIRGRGGRNLPIKLLLSSSANQWLCEEQKYYQRMYRCVSIYYGALTHTLQKTHRWKTQVQRTYLPYLTAKHQQKAKYRMGSPAGSRRSLEIPLQRPAPSSQNILHRGAKDPAVQSACLAHAKLGLYSLHHTKQPWWQHLEFQH